MPLVEQPTPEPWVVLAPIPEHEAQRAALYSTSRGRFHKAAWLLTGAGTPLSMALRLTPFSVPLGHFLQHSPPPTQQR